MPTRPGTPERPLRVAVVGAGPSGFYTAAALLAAPDLAVSIDLFDRLPAPHGLVRYGVAPDHPKIKAVSRVFDKLALDPRLRFLGNVEVGRDLRHGDLRRHYDQVVYAVGGQSDRQLGVPGEDLPGSYSSTEFVAWYSSHPDFIDLEPSLECEEAAVVGIGNVAMDVARVLVRDPDELAVTDIADVALDALRREPGAHRPRPRPPRRRCRRSARRRSSRSWARWRGWTSSSTPPSWRSTRRAPPSWPRIARRRRTSKLLRAFAERGPTGRPRRIHLRFLVSPVELVERDGRVGGLRLERNRLEPTAGGGTRAVGTGEFETLPVGMVVRAVGYRSLPLPDLPFDDRKCIIPNDKGRVLDPQSGRPQPGDYVVGWVKRGPTGLIGTNKPDGVETAAAMIEDLPSLVAANDEDAAPAALDHLLAGRGVRVVTFADWQRLDRLETERGQPHGRPRVKLCRVEEMLAALENADRDIEAFAHAEVTVEDPLRSTAAHRDDP